MVEFVEWGEIILWQTLYLQIMGYMCIHVCIVKNEDSDWLTNARDSIVRAEIQAKTSPFSEICIVAVKLVPNSAATSLRHLLQRLQDSHPTVFCIRQVFSELHTNFQSNRPPTFLAAEFDGFTCE